MMRLEQVIGADLAMREHYTGLSTRIPQENTKMRR
jgi:hypothetical protein